MVGVVLAEPLLQTQKRENDKEDGVWTPCLSLLIQTAEAPANTTFFKDITLSLTQTVSVFSWTPGNPHITRASK